MRSKRVRCLVEFVLPENVTPEAACGYVEEAVSCWRGGLCPPFSDDGAGGFNEGDPMFELDSGTVRVELTRARFPSATTTGA